jgi:hypothetical protein
MFSVIPASARDRDYEAPTWRYDSPGHEYRWYGRERDSREHRRDRDRFHLRNSYYEESYDDYRNPLSRKDLIWEINSQGYYWPYNIRPSHRNNYLTAFAFDRRYGGRSVYLRINQYTGHIFYFRYNN